MADIRLYWGVPDSDLWLTTERACIALISDHDENGGPHPDLLFWTILATAVDLQWTDDWSYSEARSRIEGRLGDSPVYTLATRDYPMAHGKAIAAIRGYVEALPRFDPRSPL